MTIAPNQPERKQFQTLTEADARLLQEGAVVELRPGGYVSKRAEHVLSERQITVVRLKASDDVDHAGSTGAAETPERGRKPVVILLSGVGALAAAVLAAVVAFNYFGVMRPVAKQLDGDSRNAGFAMTAHYRFYVDPNTLVIDLRQVDSASPLDLCRGLFQAAKVMSDSGKRFERVVLARTGHPVFHLKGDDFARLGTEFANGQNPVFLIRTLPEKLYRPNGEAAFPQWTGGLLGVLGKQMEDVTTAVRTWTAGG
jgi:hypothetical protein